MADPKNRHLKNNGKEMLITFYPLQKRDIKILATAFCMPQAQVIKDAVNYAIFKHKDEALKILKRKGIDPDSIQ